MELSSLESYEDAISFLSEHRDVERTVVDGETPSFNLREMKRAVEELNHPQQSVPLVHVGGTKGKGSVCYMMETILFGAGFTPGAFLSPHLLELRDRLRVNRESVSRERFTDLLNRVRERLSGAERDVTSSELTFFEWLTLMAFVLFEEEPVDAGLLEVGMGGRLDSTNVATPDVSVITTIGLDHEAFLGDTVDRIAAEKAGIVKPDVPLVTSAKTGQGRDVILDRAGELDTPAYALDRDFHIVERIPGSGSATGQKVILELANGDRLGLHLSVPGLHQAENLATAVQAAYLFVEQQEGLWNSGIVSSAVRQLSLPGRFQIFHRRPPVILDGAHNPLSCEALVEALGETGFQRPGTLLFGTASDKDWRRMLCILASAFSRIVLTKYDHPRAEDPENVRTWCREEFPDLEVEVRTPPADVVRAFIEQSEQKRPLIVLGSFYLIGEILRESDDFSEES